MHVKCKLNIRRLVPWCAVAVVAMGALLAVWPGRCANDERSLHDRNERYAQVDSVLGGVHGVDSLKALAEQYHKAGDALGEMLARKRQGSALRGDARFAEAIEVHRQGLDLALSMGDTIEVIAALNNIGTDHRRLGELSTANGYYYQALKYCDAYRDKNNPEAVKCRVVALNGIGNIEIELHNYPTADSVLHEALAGEMSLGSNTGMAINYANLGSVKRAGGEIDSAWYYYRKSMEHNQLAKNKNGEALCHLRFGELCEDEHRYSHALEEYKQAYEQLKEVNDSWHLMESCLALASVCIRLGEEEDAHRYLHEAQTEAERTGSKEHLANAHMVHYELSMREGNYESALKHYIKGDELQDSIYGLEKNDEMRSQRIEYQSHRLNGELDVLNNDIANLKRNRNMQLVSILVLLAMMCAAIAALVYALRTRAHSQRLMRQIEETRSLFFTNVVHQLRTPLTAIMGAIDVINAEVAAPKDEKPLSPTQLESVEIINRQGQNLLMLVDRILEVGGVRSAIKEPEWRTGDAVTFMRMVLESYRERCVERHIELTYAPRESEVTIDTVPSFLNTILGRLIENAIEYSRDYSRVTVTSRVDDDMLTIKVIDNGIGISENDLPHVFEPFFRGAAAEQLVDGVGIGLTVVRDMTMAMGGSVAVESTKETGTVFTVVLPCRHGNGVKLPFEKALKPLLPTGTGAKMRRSTAPVAEQQSRSLPVVLIVEDHNDVARLVGKVMSRDYEVHYAGDGEQGFAKADELKPDLIITDVKMPNMDGYELCRTVRSARHLCHVPIIMLSARTSLADRIRGIGAGADAYLVKPFSPDEMRAWAVRLLTCRDQLRDVYAQGAPGAATLAAAVGVPADTAEDDRRFLEAFAAEVNARMTDGIKLDMDKVALGFKMGESQLRRRVQQITGKSMAAYVMMLRMERAKSLLCSRPDLLVGEVAEHCGFVDVAYFSRVFRQHYGMTPTQARQSSTGA